MRVAPHLWFANKAPNIRVFRSVSDGGFLFAVVETNAKDQRSYEGDVLDRLVESAGSTVDSVGIDSGAAFAAALADRLHTDTHLRQAIGAVFYAAVSIAGESETLSVCTAGDIRVHAVSADGTLLRRTRDHNAIDDDEEGAYRDVMLDQRDFLRYVPTRAIPTTASKPVECVAWPLEDIRSIVICSSVLHRYRDPEEYLPSLINGAIPSFAFAAVVQLDVR